MKIYFLVDPFSLQTQTQIPRQVYIQKGLQVNHLVRIYNFTIILDLRPIPLFATMDMCLFKDTRVQLLRNSGMKGPFVLWV